MSRGNESPHHDQTRSDLFTPTTALSRSNRNLDSSTTLFLSDHLNDPHSRPSLEMTLPLSPLSTSRTSRLTPPISPLSSRGSPSRLVARSPLNASPRDDLAFLFDALNSAPEDGPGLASPPPVDTRSARLKADIERTAEALRRMDKSSSSLSINNSTHQSSPSLRNQNQYGNGSNGSPEPKLVKPTGGVQGLSQSGLIVGLGLGLASSTSSINHSSRASSLYEDHSDSVISPIPTLSFQPRTKGREQTRKKEVTETNQSCWVWSEIVKREGTGILGLVGKGPAIRDVPSAVKRKVKRESTLISPTSIDYLVNADETAGLKVPSAPRASFVIGPNCITKEGGWRKVTSVLRSDGYFRIFNEDKVVLHSIYLPAHDRTDIRIVDSSLLGESLCIVINRPAVITATFDPDHTSSQSSNSLVGGLSSTSPFSIRTAAPTTKTEGPLYLFLPSLVAVQTMLMMTQAYAKAEFLGIESRSFLKGKSRDEEDEEDFEEMMDDDDDGDISSRCRVWRSMTISINEGRGVGEWSATPSNSISERRSTSDFDSTSSLFDGSYSPRRLDPHSRSSTTAFVGPKTLSRGGGGGGGSAKERDETGTIGFDVFAEIVRDGEVLARTNIIRGTSSPSFRETFTFTDLPAFNRPVSIHVYQHHRHTKPTLLGTSTIRIADLVRGETVDDWWVIRPVNHDARSTETVGELSMSVKIGEEIILPSTEYASMLHFLKEDSNADLAVDLANDFPSELEAITSLLLRIYQAESLLIPRILQLATKEIETDLTSNAVLFRGNSILTKSIEQYMRLIGAEYLEASIGDSIRRLCADKTESFELDPSKMKLGWKERDLTHNTNSFMNWMTTLWNCIYAARQKCPNEIRQVFGHIQAVVTSNFGDDRTMRSTSISAFVFLRFCVPAIINPVSFGLVDEVPDARSQRNLILVAKTLQGLANFSTFGTKEPWMGPMNSFVTNNSSAFVDYISHISTPASVVRMDWTSSNAPIYFAPNRLRATLPNELKDGLPTLPHLIDLSKCLALLATTITSKTRSPSTLSSRGTKSLHYSTFIECCRGVKEESQRRGGEFIRPRFQINSDIDPMSHTASETTRKYPSTPRPALSSQVYSPTSSNNSSTLDINASSSPQYVTVSLKDDSSNRKARRGYMIDGSPIQFDPHHLASLSQDHPRGTSLQFPIILSPLPTSTDPFLDSPMNQIRNIRTTSTTSSIGSPPRRQRVQSSSTSSAHSTSYSDHYHPQQGSSGGGGNSITNGSRKLAKKLSLARMPSMSFLSTATSHSPSRRSLSEKDSSTSLNAEGGGGGGGGEGRSLWERISVSGSLASITSSHSAKRSVKASL